MCFAAEIKPIQPAVEPMTADHRVPTIEEFLTQTPKQQAYARAEQARLAKEKRRNATP